MGDKIRTAVIGVGYLGRFHAQKYCALPNAELVAVVDINPATARQVAAECGTMALTDYHELFDRVEAVSIVVPTSHHYAVAKACLQNGIHVLLEKPMTATLVEADELIALAKGRGLILQVGHLERFNSATVALRGILNVPRFIESHRLAPFNRRGTDISVVLDLMIHDIDIILTIVDSAVSAIQANGASVLTQDIDIANARIQFANGCVANVTASRISRKAQRKMRIFQQDAYISIDFQDKILAVYRKGTREIFPGIPEIINEEKRFEHSDAIKAEIQAFLATIRGRAEPSVSGEDGRQALAIALQIGRLLSQASN
jgi:predicted dehydrogenase